MIAQVATALVFFAGEGVELPVAQATLAAVKERMSREGGAPIDLSAEHRTLHTKTLYMDFTTPPPSFLPPELADPWKRGNEACVKQVGPTEPQASPYLRAHLARLAAGCKQSVGLAMWDLLLKARQVTRVMEVQLSMNRRVSGVSVSAWWLELDGSGRVISQLDLSADQVAATLAKAVDDLLKGGGTAVLPAKHPMPSVGVPEVEVAAFGRPDPVKVPGSCTGLPARLEVFPLGKVTRAIEAAYQTVPADRRRGKPLRCDLVLFPDSDDRNTPYASARLTCPPRQIRAAVPVAQAPKLISMLADRAVEGLCSPQGAQ